MTSEITIFENVMNAEEVGTPLVCMRGGRRPTRGCNPFDHPPQTAPLTTSDINVQLTP